MRKTVFLIVGAAMLVPCITSDPSYAQARASRAIERNDRDGDGNRYLSLQELRARFGETTATPFGDKSTTLAEGQVRQREIDEFTLCAMGRGFGCTMKPAIERGLFETGLRPRFPSNADCRDIDEQWAISYTWKRNRESYHGGIDMPAPWETLIIAAADGTVIGKFRGENNPRGVEIVLRHSPVDTGLPVWTFTQYTHFSEMPKQKLGQRVRLGEVLGPTGNTGISIKTSQQSKKRRSVIHFGVFFNSTGNYAALPRKIIPANGHWMDPNALYRNKGPFDSKSLKALPRVAKKTPVAVLFEDGEKSLPNAKIVWPYRCKRQIKNESNSKLEDEDEPQYSD